MHKCRTKRRDSQEYWEARLKRMGLTMNAGRQEWITYGHMISDIDFDGRVVYVPEKSGESLEIGEWPVSLC